MAKKTYRKGILNGTQKKFVIGMFGTIIILGMTYLSVYLMSQVIFIR